tara:strand:- start:16244 stop:18136 length:1893 start_codon:yes stop_codon:yes gene_type:complete
MCGIVGFSGNIERNKLVSSLSVISHRGPDASGIYFDKEQEIGLGHTRLSIIDLAPEANQPLIDNKNDLVISYNGEIYNYKELRSDLIKKGHNFDTLSDTEVVLKMYQEYRYNMLEKLNGIFAFAIWDMKNKQLFLARDNFGVKPLYYYSEDNKFIFSSEIKAMEALVSIKKDVDIAAVHNYLNYLWSPGEKTLFKSVKKLNPGNALIVKDSKIDKHWSWYTLPTRNPDTEIKHIDNLIFECKRKLEKAVESQLVSDVPVGAFLSGGLDSSSIVSLARKFKSDIQCFTIQIKDDGKEEEYNDLPYAREVAKHLKVPLEVIDVTPNEIINDIEKMVYHLDEPLADPSCLNVLYISHLANKHGIKVLLSGVGGDDLLTGYRRHIAAKYDHYFMWIPLHLRKKIESFSTSLSQNSIISRRVTKLFKGFSLEGNDRIANFFVWTPLGINMNLYSRKMQESIKNYNKLDILTDFLDNFSSDLSPIEKILLLEQRFFLADHNLNYTDKMSMAEGIEVRVPFLDKNFVEFCSQIDEKYKQKRTVSKWILKKAMEPDLPKEVIYRPKTGFGAPIRKWVKDDLRDYIQSMLSKQNIEKRNIFNYKEIQRLLYNNQKGMIDASYVIFSILCLEIWFQQHID